MLRLTKVVESTFQITEVHPATRSAMDSPSSILVVGVQQSQLPLADVDSGVVLDDGDPPTVLLLEGADLLLVEPQVLREHVLDLGAAGPGEVREDVALVEDPPGVRPVGGQMVGHEARDVEVSPDLQDLVKEVVDGLPNLLVRDHVDVVEDDHGLLELLDGDGVLVERLVELHPLGFYVVQGLVLRQGRGEVDGGVACLLFQSYPA